MTLLPRIVRCVERSASSMCFHYLCSANMSTNKRRLRVLVDMDGVIADFEGGFLKKYQEKFPNEPFISLEDRRGFWVSTQYGDMRSDLCVSVETTEEEIMEQFVEPLDKCAYVLYHIRLILSDRVRINYQSKVFE